MTKVFINKLFDALTHLWSKYFSAQEEVAMYCSIDKPFQFYGGTGTFLYIHCNGDFFMCEDITFEQKFTWYSTGVYMYMHSQLVSLSDSSGMCKEHQNNTFCEQRRCDSVLNWNTTYYGCRHFDVLFWPCCCFSNQFDINFPLFLIMIIN